MTSSSDEQFGGGFAEVRDGVTVDTVIRPTNPVDDEPPAGGSS